VVALVAVSEHVPPSLWAVAGTCGCALLMLALLHLLLLRPALDAQAGRSPWWVVVRLRLHDSGTRIRNLLSLRWRQLLPGSAGYLLAQVTLLFFSLRFVGLNVSITVVLMAAAIERLGTLVPVTPGGAGVAEIGTVAWLVATGLDPAPVVAGVLLYRIFLVAMEIPVGGLLLAGWAMLQRPTVRIAGGGTS
jgi:uncharacterized membrane protein YbhN (UPF0104 family)